MFPIETISAKMLDYYVGRSDALIIDLRDTVSYHKSHVKGAVNVPYGELENGYAFPKEKMIDFLLRQRWCQYGGGKGICAQRIQNTIGHRRICGIQRKKSCNFQVTMIR